jgi:hypothetical protein
MKEADSIAVADFIRLKKEGVEFYYQYLEALTGGRP